MSFIPIYLCICCIIACIFGMIAISKIFKETKIETHEDNYIQIYVHKKSILLKRAKMDMSVSKFLAYKFILAVCAGVCSYFVIEQKIMMLFFITAGFMIPDLVIYIKKSKEEKQFGDRFIRALAQMASSLHSGLSVEQSIDSVADCELIHPSMREEFSILSSNMKLGIPISTSLYEFADKYEDRDIYDVAVAVTIMMEIGGDIGTAIEKIEKNIEDRLLYKKKRKSMLAESKMLALFADILPIFIFLGTCVFMPGTITSYFQSPTLMIVLMTAIILIAAGSVVIRKMLKNEKEIN